MKSHTTFQSILLALGLAAAMAPSAWAQSAPQSGDQPHEVTREEVIADLTMWRRAGMDSFQQSDTLNTFDPAYIKAMNAYRQMRSGTEYTAELAHLSKEAGK